MIVIGLNVMPSDSDRLRYEILSVCPAPKVTVDLDILTTMIVQSHTKTSSDIIEKDVTMLSEPSLVT